MSEPAVFLMGTPAQAGAALGGEITILHAVRFHGGHWFFATRFVSLSGTDGSSELDADAVACIRIFWNGADSITPIRSAEKRPFSLSRRCTILSMVSAS